MSSTLARPAMPKTTRPKPVSQPAPKPHQNAPTTAQKQNSTTTSAPKTTNRTATKATKIPVIEHAPIPQQPPAWLNYIGPVWSGARAATQAFALVFAVLALLVLVALLADSESASWGGAFAVATRFWLLAHGGRVAFGGLQLSILPLGFTMLCLLVLRMFGRRAGTPYLVSAAAAKPKPQSAHQGPVKPILTLIIAGALTYSLLTTLAARIIGEPPLAVFRATTGALLLGALGLSWRLVPLLPVVRQVCGKCPPMVQLGLKAAKVSLLATAGTAALFTSVWAVLGFANAQAVAQTLQPGAVGSVVVGVSNLALLPNWLIWVAAWLAGPGFSVGTGSVFSPGLWASGPLPALPIVAALPPENWAGPYWLWVPALVLLIGAATGWYLWRALGSTGTWSQYGVAAGTAVGTLMLVMAAGQWLAAGSLGTGRLAEVGANPWLVSLVFGGELAAGIAMVVFGNKYGNRKLNNE